MSGKKTSQASPKASPKSPKPQTGSPNARIGPGPSEYKSIGKTVDEIKRTYLFSQTETFFINISEIKFSSNKADPSQARSWNQDGNFFLFLALKLLYKPDNLFRRGPHEA